MADPAPAASPVGGAAGEVVAPAGPARRGDTAAAALYFSAPESSTALGRLLPAAGPAGSAAEERSGSSSSIPSTSVTHVVPPYRPSQTNGTNGRVAPSSNSSASASPSPTASLPAASPALRAATSVVSLPPVLAATSSSSSSSASSSLRRSQQQSCNSSSSSSASVSPPHQQHGRPAAAPATGAAQERPPQQQQRSNTSAHPSAGPVFGPSGGIAVTLRPSSGFAHPPTAPAALATSRLGGSVAAGGSQQPRFSVYSSTRQAKVCPYCGPGAATGGCGSRSGGAAGAGAGSTIVFDASSGDQICRECGFVVEEKVLSEEQEWRNFSAEVASSSRGGSDRNRVGEALDAWLESGGVGTSMLVGSAGGLAGGSRAATVARRLQQLHEATTASFATGGGAGGRDKQLRAAFSCLRLIGEAFALRDNVLERAKEITKDLMDSQQFPRTRNNTTTMLAVTYLACREAGVTRTVKELVVYDRAITEKELGKAINRIKKQVPQRGDASSAESATQLLPRYCSRLQLSVHVSDVAEHVAKRAAQVIISSHRPNSIAGAAIWLVVQLLNSATNPHLPKAAEIASVTGAGEHTLRSIYKDMLDVAEHLLPGEFQPTVEGGLEGLRARSTSRKRKCIEGS